MFSCIYIVEHLFTFCINLYVAVLYFLGVATIAALVGQHVVTKVIAILGRASLIIFILAGTIQRPID
jgi:fucose 4-O-acetylase-like acetyltransferase